MKVNTWLVEVVAEQREFVDIIYEYTSHRGRKWRELFQF